MVIELKSAKPMNVTSIDLLPAPLKKVRSHSSKLFLNMLASMFDNADDTLFELADKAINNADQTMYFDSMREVRIKRQMMEKRFAQALQDSFKNLQRNTVAQTADSGQQALSDESLTLVQDDELEESVAIRGMVSKVNNLFGDALQQLTQRMDAVLNNTSLSAEANPLGPQCLCEAFQQACLELEINIRAKLVIYKLFEKFVLSELADVYDWTNKFLAEQGVLPQIKPQSSSKAKPYRPSAPSSASVSQQTAHSPADEDSGQDEVFSLLRGLLATAKNKQSTEPGPLPVAESGPVLAPSELVQMLSTVQHSVPASDNLVSIEPQPLNVRQALHQQVEKRGGSVQAVGRVDDDSINLVTMLFEFILDDHNLPVPMKALLARLQIPMLKVALLDKTFFSRGAHPARKLLNELASAAMSWNPPADLSRDALYNKVRAVVGTVLDEFEDDVNLFPGLLEDFTDFVGKERRKAELIEQRTRDAEEGLGKTQRARAEVGKTINEKGAGRVLPPVVLALLREGWANYLFLLHVREGAESEAWQAGVQVVDDLIWSTDRSASFSHRSALLTMIPSLLQRLREGLNAISFSKNRMRELFVELEAEHMKCLRSEYAEETGDLGGTPAGSLTQGNDSADHEEGSQNRRPEEAAAEVIVEAPELEPLDGDSAAVVAEENDAIADLVDSMAVGAWVEFHNNEGEKNRCKLAAIIRVSGKYIFVNRLGIKVAEYTRSGLIEAARAGVISVLDNALLFDRALESVIGHLREMKD